MTYELTPKGERYREQLLKKIDSFQRRWQEAGASHLDRPKWNYKLGRRAYILDAIYTGEPVEANIMKEARHILEIQGWPYRSQRYAMGMHKEIADLLRKGYIKST